MVFQYLPAPWSKGQKGVTGIYRTPVRKFKEMVAMMGMALPLHGIKVGVGCDAPYVREIAGFLKKKKVPLVIDPVIAAKNGNKNSLPKVDSGL